MARPLRLEYEGAIYHVMSRGDHSERIYRGDGGAVLFIKLLGEACVKSDWQVHAYSLMSNPLPSGIEKGVAHWGVCDTAAAAL